MKTFFNFLVFVSTGIVAMFALRAIGFEEFTVGMFTALIAIIASDVHRDLYQV